MTGSLQRRNLIAFVVFDVILALIFSRGEYWNFSDGMANEALFLVLVLFLVVLLPLFFVLNRKAGEWLNRLMEAIRSGCMALWENRTAVLKNAGICVLCVPVSLGISYGFAGVMNLENNLILQLSVFAAVFLCAAIYLMKDKAADRPELVFFVITLILGIYMIEVRPTEVGYSWDDQEHFERTISLATLNGPYYEADEAVYLNAWEPASKASRTERQERTEFLNESFANHVVHEPYRHGNLKHISIESYLPYAAGIVFGRGIGLSYVSSLKCGLFFNVLFYAAVMTWAMSRLKFGKILLAVIALFPTNMYMLTSFSYDPWITAWIALAFSVFFSYLQQPEKKLTGKDTAIMLGAFMLGCLPKAIYFVLMFPLLFMPKDSFTGPKQRRSFIVLVLMTAFFLAATFVLPMFIGGAGTGDRRGGSEVNATEQIRFIVSEPLAYAKILFRYLTEEYLNPLRADRYYANYAYMGMASEASLPVGLLLLAVMFTDRNGKPGKTMPVMLSAMFALLSMAAVIATAMYVSFTPVCLETINGAQHRYLIPMVFPALYVHGFDRFENRMDKILYNMIPMMIMAAVIICTIGSRLYAMY